MRVRFSQDFDYTPSKERRVTIAYKAGWEGTVKREAGEAAVALGCADELTDPAQPPQPPESEPKPRARRR